MIVLLKYYPCYFHKFDLSITTCDISVYETDVLPLSYIPSALILLQHVYLSSPTLVFPCASILDSH